MLLFHRVVLLIAMQPRNGFDQQFDSQWQRSLNSIIMDSTVETLQCLVLAQLYCFSRGDYNKLLQYKSLAVGIALRLGLNQNQRKFSLGPLGSEMRKRSFWCVYCLDRYIVTCPFTLLFPANSSQIPAFLQQCLASQSFSKTRILILSIPPISMMNMCLRRDSCRLYRATQPKFQVL
jgi:Fungal specific transcription factor domain